MCGRILGAADRMPRKTKRRSARWLWVLFLLILVGGFLALRHPPLRENLQARWTAYRQKHTPTVAPSQPTTAPAPSPLVAPPAATVPAPAQPIETPLEFAGAFTYAGEPKAINYPNQLTMLRNTAYLVAYDETRRNPAWVAYRIPRERLDGKFPRPSRFAPDTRLTVRVTHDDYTRSGFDRGHMAPNHAIASRFGKLAQDETFLMTNVVPQRPALNQGPWRLMEEALTDRAAVNFGEIWVIVGPIYDELAENLASGPEIPDAFFCVVADSTPSGPRLQAFVMPQDTPRAANFRDYVVAVDAAELQAGLDFFWMLPDLMENPAEAAAAHWLE